MNTIHTPLLIIGAGPGGYVAAIRAAQNGIATTVVDAQALGGTCLNVGCIPSKAMLHVAEQFESATRAAASGGSALGISVSKPQIDLAKAVAWKDGIVTRLTGGVGSLLKRQKVQVIMGSARLVDGKTAIVKTADGETKITCDNLLLATGSTPVQIPSLPYGADIVSSTGALALTQVPKHLAVVGGGYIGLELGTAFAKLGAKVTVVEAQDRILPAYDAEIGKPVAKSLTHLGVAMLTGAKAQGYDASKHQLTVALADGKTQTIAADKVLVSVGRKTMTEGLNLEALQLTMNGQAVVVDAQCRTSMKGVWAIGDLTGEPMLAHRAMAQGEVVADAIAGKARAFNPAVIPAVCYTDPEVVVVGLSPEEAKAQGLEIKQASFPLAGNGRAMTLEASDGFVRVVARADNHRIIGWQAVGKGVAELASTFAHSIEMLERLEDTAHIVHAHPTLGEVVQEAAHKALGHALHA